MTAPQEIELCVYIEAPRERVFDALSDYSQFFRGGSVKYCHVTPAPVPPPAGVGALREVQNGGVHFVEEITGYVRPERIDYQVLRCSLPLDHKGGSTRFLERGTGTEVRWTSRFVVPVPLFSKTATKLFGMMLVSELNRMLIQTKHELEA